MAREQETPHGITLQDQLVSSDQRELVNPPYLTREFVLLYLLDTFDYLSGSELEQLANQLYTDVQTGDVTPLLQIIKKTSIVERRATELKEDPKPYQGNNPLRFFGKVRITDIDDDPVLNLVALHYSSDEMEYQRPPVPHTLAEAVKTDPHPDAGIGPIRPLLLSMKELSIVGLAYHQHSLRDRETTYFPTAFLGRSHAGAVNTTFVHIDWKDYQHPLVIVGRDQVRLFDRPHKANK